MSGPWIKFRSGGGSSAGVSSSGVQRRLKLLCFPYAGGTATVYRRWARHLPEDIELCPVEYPGHGTRRAEPLLKRIGEMTQAAADGLGEEFDGEYAIFGHSLGAIIAFELVRELRSRNAQLPVRLFVSARRAPQLPVPHRDMYTMPDDQFIQTVVDRYGGIPKEVLDEPELLQLMMPMVRADLEMYETYHYREAEPLPIPISCFGGEIDNTHPKEQLKAWEKQTTDDFRLRILPGDHFYINTATELLLNDCVDQLRERSVAGEIV